MSTNDYVDNTPHGALLGKDTKPVKNPVKEVVEVMRRVEVKTPDAAKNEKSIIDKDGKRITLNDEDVRFNYFKGRFVPIDKKK